MTNASSTLSYSVPTFLTPRGVQVENVMDFQSLTGYVRHLRPVLSSLDSLLQDLTRESLEGLSPVFCLDFSELHDLLVIPEATADRSEIVPSLRAATTILESEIENGRHTFALLPGTVFELHNFILRTLQKSGVMASEVMPADESLSMIISMLSSLPDRTDEEILKADEVLPRLEELQRLTDLLTLRTSRFHWLLDKISRGRLQLIHEEPWFREIVWPSIVFTEVLEDLSKQRPGQSINNEEDALNYAICVGASNRFKSTKMVYYLMARGHAVRTAFSRSPWLRDPVATQAAYSPSTLLRDPSYLAMRTHWEDLYKQDPVATREVLSAFPRTFRETLTQLQGLKRHTVSLGKAGRETVDLSKVPQEILQPIVDTAKAFNERFSSHLRPLFLAWETHREAEGLWAPPRETSKDLEALLRELLEKYTEAEEGAREITARLDEAERTAREASDSVRGKVGLKAEISAENSERYGPEVVELTFFLNLNGEEDAGVKERQVVARADVFPGYYSMWWNTGIDLHSFFDCADYLARIHHILGADIDIAPTREKLESRGLGLVIKTDAGGTAKYRYLGDTEHDIFPLNIFSREPILHTIAERGAVSVRLFTKYFDLWFNFEPQLRSGRRMGIISHVVLPSLVAEFVATTTYWPVSSVFLQKVIAEHLASLVPRPLKKGEE